MDFPPAPNFYELGIVHLPSSNHPLVLYNFRSCFSLVFPPELRTGLHFPPPNSLPGGVPPEGFPLIPRNALLSYSSSTALPSRHPYCVFATKFLGNDWACLYSPESPARYNTEAVGPPLNSSSPFLHAFLFLPPASATFPCFFLKSISPFFVRIIITLVLPHSIGPVPHFPPLLADPPPLCEVSPTLHPFALLCSWNF